MLDHALTLSSLVWLHLQKWESSFVVKVVFIWDVSAAVSSLQSATALLLWRMKICAGLKPVLPYVTDAFIFFGVSL